MIFNMQKYDKQTLESVRSVTVHKILGLENNGRRISIRCPIHNERSPSFVIYPTGDFYCYGCAKSGQNALDLLILMGSTFPDSIEYLLQHR